jgi:hypothetical protein
VRTLGAWFYAVSGALVILLAGLGIGQAVSDGVSPVVVMRRMLYALIAFILLPLFYSATIRSFSLMGEGLYSYGDRILREAGGGVKKSDQVFGALLNSSAFDPDQWAAMPKTEAVRSQGTGNPVLDWQMTGKGSPTAVNFDRGPSLKESYGLAPMENKRWSDKPLLNPVKEPGKVFAHVVNDPGMAIDYTQAYMTADLGMMVSRLLQIALGLWAMVEIVFLLVLKGSQVVAVVLNYFLGIVACAFLANDRTEQIFWSWMKTHITVCLWSLMWALLILVMHIIALGANSLKGMDGITQIGAFLFPFILYGAFRKFHEVSDLANSLAATSNLIRSAAGVVSHRVSDFGRRSQPYVRAGVNRVSAGTTAPMKALAAKASMVAASVAAPAVGSVAPKLGAALGAYGAAGRSPVGRGPGEFFKQANKDLAGRLAVGQKAGGRGPWSGPKGSYLPQPKYEKLLAARKAAAAEGRDQYDNRMDKAIKRVEQRQGGK